jgi:hypothetical protein
MPDKFARFPFPRTIDNGRDLMPFVAIGTNFFAKRSFFNLVQLLSHCQKYFSSLCSICRSQLTAFFWQIDQLIGHFFLSATGNVKGDQAADTLVCRSSALALLLKLTKFAPSVVLIALRGVGSFLVIKPKAEPVHIDLLRS